MVLVLRIGEYREGKVYRSSNAGSIIILAFTSLDESEVLCHLTHLTFDGYCPKGQLPAALVGSMDHFTS